MVKHRRKATDGVARRLPLECSGPAHSWYPPRRSPRIRPRRHRADAPSKDFLYGVLKQHNYEPLPSGTNFVMFPIRMKGEDFVSRMMDQGVSIRQWKFDGWCRVSMGTMPQMQAFAEGLKLVS